MMNDRASEADNSRPWVAIVGRLGVYPMVKLSLIGRRLLAYLALRGRAVARAIASAELWPDVPDEVGRANLRRALWHLPRDWVAHVGDEIEFAGDTDLSQAQDAAELAFAGEPLTLAEIRLLSEELLPGWLEEWALPAQEAFHLLRVQALEAACRTMTATGCHPLAIQAGSAAVAAEPLSESAAEALIEAHLAQHNRFAAIRCFNDLSNRLEEELGVSPEDELAKRVASCSRMAAEAH